MAARQAKAAELAAWSAFLERMASGRYEEEDARYLAEVAEMAKGQRDRSRVLSALGQAESPENAHAVLLKLGYWDGTVNPYPARSSQARQQQTSNTPPIPGIPSKDLTPLGPVQGRCRQHLTFMPVMKT